MLTSQSSNRRRQSKYGARMIGSHMATWFRSALAAMVTAETRLVRSASSHAKALSRPVKFAGTGVPGSARR